VDTAKGNPRALILAFHAELDKATVIKADKVVLPGEIPE